MENFIIVLFKNKKKKKIIKGYVTSKNANLKYKKLIENNNIPFEVLYENGSKCKYEIALLSKTSSNQDDYDVAIVAVAHDKFKELGSSGLRNYLSSDGIIFDLKAVYPSDEVDLRL